MKKRWVTGRVYEDVVRFLEDIGEYSAAGALSRKVDPILMSASQSHWSPGIRTPPSNGASRTAIRGCISVASQSFAHATSIL